MISKPFFYFMIPVTMILFFINSLGVLEAGENKVKQQYRTIVEDLNNFSISENDTNNIIAIGDKIENLPVPNEYNLTKWRGWRKKKAILWLKLIDAVYKNIDLSSDVDNIQLNIAPSSLFALDSGVAVSEIKDTVIREQYKKAMIVNSQKADMYRFQKKLHEIYNKLLLKTEEYLKEQYTLEQEDTDELYKLVNTYITSKDSKDRLKNGLFEE